MLQENSSNKEKWPKIDVLPPLPDAVFQLQKYLMKINKRGTVKRIELLKLAGSSEQLDSWLRDLKDILGLVDSRIERGHTIYFKTQRGRRWEHNTIDEWDYTLAISTRYAGDRRQPLFPPALYDEPAQPKAENSAHEDEDSTASGSPCKANAPDEDSPRT